MNGPTTNRVWGYALAGGRQVAVGVWGYAGLGTRQPAAVTEGMKQFNQILRPKRAPGGEFFFRPQWITSDDFPRLQPPPLYLGSGQDPPPLCALRAATRPPPVVSLSRKHFHDMGRPAVARFKVKGKNVSYVRYMQVWSLRGMGVCSGRCVEARICGMRVCRSKSSYSHQATHELSITYTH